MTKTIFTARARTPDHNGQVVGGWINWMENEYRYGIAVSKNASGVFEIEIDRDGSAISKSLPSGLGTVRRLSPTSRASVKVVAAAVAFANTGVIEANAKAEAEQRAASAASAMAFRAAATRLGLQTSLEASLGRDSNPTRQQAARDALWFFQSMTDAEVDDLRRLIQHGKV